MSEPSQLFILINGDPLMQSPSEHRPSNTTSKDAPVESHLLQSRRKRLREKIGNYWALFILISFLLGLGGGYVLGLRDPAGVNISEASAEASQLQGATETTELLRQINPPEGFTLPANYGDIGPQMLTAGAIDYDAFVGVYEQAGRPLTDGQLDILSKGSNSPVIINRENAYFLLNFFWALGLANENPILTEGPMVQYSEGQVERFASTGGWTIAVKPITEVYASAPILSLTDEQQELVEDVAEKIYRPCCNNPTHFPDCNHGMAMLGMLELMASQGASADEMFRAAKYANAFWYPQQTMELAAFFKYSQDLDFDQVDSHLLLGQNFSSAAGFQNVHSYLASKGLLEQAPGSGNSCGV
jgi:hypothetical protein